MNRSNDLNAPVLVAPLLERFFLVRLMQQRAVSAHTVSSYRDSLSQLLMYASGQLREAPSELVLEQLDAPLIANFLNDLKVVRNVSVRTRNLRLTAIHSFFRFASYELLPSHAQQIQRVLAIPGKRFDHPQVGFLNRDETDALLQAPDRNVWTGKRDHAFILTAVQTGLRVSEMTGLRRKDLTFAASSHLQVFGKGRKQRFTPLAKPTCKVLKSWLREPQRGRKDYLFPNIRGERMTIHGVQHLLRKNQARAASRCPSLEQKRVTVHLLRHTAAMNLLAAGVDRSVMALWLGHKSIETTQIYLEATLEMKDAALEMMAPYNSKPGRFKAPDKLLAFLSNL